MNARKAKKKTWQRNKEKSLQKTTMLMVITEYLFKERISCTVKSKWLVSFRSQNKTWKGKGKGKGRYQILLKYVHRSSTYLRFSPSICLFGHLDLPIDLLYMSSFKKNQYNIDNQTLYGCDGYKINSHWKPILNVTSN